MVHIFPGLPHGFRRFDILESSRTWDDLLLRNLEWLLKADGVGGDIQIHVQD
jgi:hypothetical protein